MTTTHELSKPRPRPTRSPWRGASSPRQQKSPPNGTGITQNTNNHHSSCGNNVSEGGLEPPHPIRVLAPQASASAIPPPGPTRSAYLADQMIFPSGGRHGGPHGELLYTPLVDHAHRLPAPLPRRFPRRFPRCSGSLERPRRHTVGVCTGSVRRPSDGSIATCPIPPPWQPPSTEPSPCAPRATSAPPGNCSRRPSKPLPRRTVTITRRCCTPRMCWHDCTGRGTTRSPPAGCWRRRSPRASAAGSTPTR